MLRFELGIERRANVTLAVYDVAGRLVRVIVGAEEFAPGISRHDWDLRDARGESVPAGIYLAKAHLGELVVTEKVVLTR